MPDGAPMPSSPRSGGVVNVGATMNISYPTITPYTLNNTIVAFARDKAYTLTRDPNPPDFREVWRDDGGGSWSDMPSTVSTCAGEKRYRVIWATTRSNRAGAIHVRAEPAAPATCTCPAGTWMETPQSLRRIMEQSALGSGQTQFIEGSRTLQLNPDHTGSLTYNGIVTETHTSDARVWLRQTKTGGTHFTWRVMNGNLLMTTLVHGNNLLNLYNEQHVPGRVITENRAGGAQSIGHSFSCEGDILHLVQLQHSSPYLPATFNVNMDFQRVGAPPPAH